MPHLCCAQADDLHSSHEQEYTEAMAEMMMMAAPPANDLEGFASAAAVKHYAPDMVLEPVHTEIAADFDFDQASAAMTVTHTIKCNRSLPIDAHTPQATIDAASSLTLHGVAFEDLSVTGEALEGHEYDGREIQLRWASPFPGKGATRTVTLKYTVIKPVTGLYFNGGAGGHGQPAHGTYVATDHETERARYWLACVDLPTVRTTLTFHLTAPASFEAVANGAAIGEPVAVEGNPARSVTSWHLDWPCPSYLISMCVGEFNSVVDRDAVLPDGRKVPIKYFGSMLMPADQVFRGLDQTPQMIEWASAKLGHNLPWQKYYQYTNTACGGAMENISLVGWAEHVHMDARHARDNKYGVDMTNFHELTHTWFGDAVVMRYFEHVWLKESWATYLPLVYLAEGYNADSTTAEERRDLSEMRIQDTRERYFAQTKRYMRPIVNRRFDSSWDMFDASTYPGGASRIHVLRGLMGDEVFWPAVSDYIHTYAKKTAETDDFRKIMEKHSGLNLTQFFDQWFYSKGHPVVKAAYAFDAKSGVASVTIEQTQENKDKSVPLFALDIPVHFVTDSGKVYRSVASFDGTSNKAAARVQTGSKPVRVELDPHGFALYELAAPFNPSQEMSLETAKNGSDVVNRVFAYRALLKDASDYSVARKVRAAMLAEKSTHVRRAVAAELAKLRHAPYLELALEQIDFETDDLTRRAMVFGLDFKHPLLSEYARAKLADPAVRQNWTYMQISSLVTMLAAQADDRDYAQLRRWAQGLDLEGMEFYSKVRAAAVRGLAQFKSEAAARDILAINATVAADKGMRLTSGFKLAVIGALAAISAWVPTKPLGADIAEAIAEYLFDESAERVRIVAAMSVINLPKELSGPHLAHVRSAAALLATQLRTYVIKAADAAAAKANLDHPAVAKLKTAVATLEKKLDSIKSKYAGQETENAIAAAARKGKPTPVAIEAVVVAADRAATPEPAPLLKDVDGFKVVRTAAELTADANALVTAVRRVHDAIGALPASERTYENVIVRLTRIENRMMSELFSYMLPRQMDPNPEVRDASTAVAKVLQEFSIEMGKREDLYLALKAAEPMMPATVDDETKRYVSRMLRDFRREGLELTPEQRAEDKVLQVRMGDLSRDFSRNVAEDKTTVEFTAAELAGMPQSYLDGLARSTTDPAKYVVTMAYPDRIPLMERCDVAETRRKVEFDAGIMAPMNKALMEEMVALRSKRAALYGYKNHAQFRLEINMAKNPETVNAFLEDLRAKLRPMAEKEIGELLAIKNAERTAAGLPVETTLHSWDKAYYLEKYKQLHFDFDSDQLKPYFAYETVLKGMFAMYSEIFGMTFTQVADAKVWHEDVTAWRVHDAKTNDYLGAFYLDMHPRPGAFTHAAVFGVRPGCQLADGSFQVPVCAMKCNFTKPTPTTPSLLTHMEIVTMWHEFGHAVHHIATGNRIKYARFSGTSTSRDFSEAPSQLYENWVWEPTVLKNLSSHYQTGAKIPDALVEKLCKSKNVGNGLQYLRQLQFCYVDMTLHQLAPGAAVPDTTELWAKISQDVALFSLQDGMHPQTTFAHIMSGYDAGYYGYLFSEVFAQDMYAKFKAAPGGIMDKAVGAAYRNEVIGRGGTRDEFDLLRTFLGREPNSDAFLKDILG
ncbi:hypothetical protein BC828DRAFT_366124 [Blastocladiella britannica]|nr:hypothetical protein BC828DRAFT_366124 [Blastocladiella britannica]